MTTERVLVLQVPRAVWLGGLVVAVVAVTVGVVLWHPVPIVVALLGLVVAAAPLMARLDAIKVAGPYLSVRRGWRWVGPIDLRTLAAIGYHPRGVRRPPTFWLVQRDAGRKLRALSIDRAVHAQLGDTEGLRVLTIAAGTAWSSIPGLTEHLHRYIAPTDAIVEPGAAALLQAADG